MRLYIKNMVCPRCIKAVKEIFDEANTPTKSVKLGEIITEQDLSPKTLKEISYNLLKEGFELIDDHKSQLISTIKSLIIENIHHKEKIEDLNWSTYIQDNLNYDYKYVSGLFSAVEGITIEHFIIRQKVEKIKELISYENLTLTQIAHQLNYSSVAHLSSQFKKITGMTPSKFKNLTQKPRIPLDKV